MTGYMIGVVIVMAAVSYLPRVLPVLIFRKKIENKFVLSFLKYMPYGVLSAMIFPAVFTSCASLVSSIVGCVTALILSFRKMGLLPVALISAAAVFVTERIVAFL